MKEDFFLLLMISNHWTGTFFPGKSDFLDFTTHLLDEKIDLYTWVKRCKLGESALIKHTAHGPG